jgi:hypothetical protein
MAVAYKVAGNSRRMSVNGAGGWVKPGGGLLDEPKENPWKPYQLKLFPKRINERWYKPGDIVYRRRVFGPGGTHWQWGDEFDYLKWQA